MRLRSSASAYFNRTPSSSGSQTTWTWSGWVKRGSLPGTNQVLFSSGASTSNALDIYFNSANSLLIEEYNVSTNYYNATSQVFRDISAWYHIIVAVDTTQATSTNRIKIYVNGSQVNSFSTANYPTQNFAYMINTSSYAAKIGIGAQYTTGYFDGYLTEINFIDGQALTPTSFGAFDSTTGVWNPKKYSGTYGTNGFYLNFSDNSGATATTIGKDSSGNGNNWTPNNISVTNVAAPNTNDSMVDTPTNYGTDTGAGGEVRGNYAVLNPVASTSWTFSNANLTGYGASTSCYFSMPITGKMYFEVYSAALVGGSQMGFVVNATIPTNVNAYTVSGYYGVNYSSSTPSYWINAVNDGISHGTISNNTIKFAVDGATGKVWIGSGSTWWGSGDPANGTNPAFTMTVPTGGLIYPIACCQLSRDTMTINTGQQPFANAAPSGFKAMCTQNMTTPTVSNGASYMAASLYTGTGASQTVSNAVNSISFQPDFVWIKSRSAATDHKLTDAVRGATKALISDTTGAETTDTNGLTAFGSTGFTVGTDTTYNNSGATYVGWQWKANGAGSSNTAGSITSTASANTTAGFSIVTFTGTAANATVGHSLGVAPSMIILKSRNSSTSWGVYHVGVGNTAAMILNSTAAQNTSSTFFQNTSPTSTVFSIGTDSSVNAAQPMIAYCFAAISGYSAFGSYTGNGSSDGPFIYLGFRPRFVLIKRTDAGANNWLILDTSRGPYNVIGPNIYANLSNAENTPNYIDSLSNGFKIRVPTDADINGSGATYIYAAFAENPFTIARAR